jgi:hypothetical protein
MHTQTLGVERDTLIEALNELLNAERAGAQVAAASLKEASGELQRSVLQQVHCGEADSCRRLRDCVSEVLSLRNAWQSQAWENAWPW